MCSVARKGTTGPVEMSKPSVCKVLGQESTSFTAASPSSCAGRRSTLSWERTSRAVRMGIVWRCGCSISRMPPLDETTSRASCLCFDRDQPVSACTGEYDVFLQHIIAPEGIAARVEHMDSRGLHHVKEDCSELAEVGARREAARRDENQLAMPPKQRSAHSHEERVDVRLTMHYFGKRQRTRGGLVDLEIRWVGDYHVEQGGGRSANSWPLLRNAARCAAMKSSVSIWAVTLTPWSFAQAAR